MTNATLAALHNVARTTVAYSKDSQQKRCSRDCNVESNVYVELANGELGSDTAEYERTDAIARVCSLCPLTQKRVSASP